MDATSEKLLDLIVEDDITRGYRIKEVPAEYLLELDAAQRHPKVRFVKLTPKKRRLIAETVQKRYHADLKNKDILSNAQLRALNVERGEWSDDMERELKTLTDVTNRLMRELYFDGLDRREQWAADLMTLVEDFRTRLAKTEDTSLDKAAVRELFDRWIGYAPDRQSEYDDRFGPNYNPDADYVQLTRQAPFELIESLGAIEDIIRRLKRFSELLEKRNRQLELQTRQARMYQDSVEQRRETSEELARLYYTTEWLDATNKPVGPLAPDFEAMWELPDELVQWLLYEAYFFANGVPDEAREYLAQWGFIPAPRETGPSAPSDASPAEPTSSSASLPPVAAAPSTSPSPQPSLATSN